MKRRLLVIPVILALCTVLAAGPAQALSGYQPFPQGRLGVSRPTIGQRLFLEEGDTFVRADLWLDGRSVPVTWDPSTGYVTYTPEGPLSPGEHHARLVIVVANRGRYASLDSEFDFVIAPDALDTLPGADPESGLALARLNAYRVTAGLPPMHHDAALGMAAGMHARHLAGDPAADAHREVPGSSPFFTGVDPWNRAEFYGYHGVVSEVVTYTGGAEGAVDAWLASLYHRIPLVHPGNTELGYGHAGGKRLAEVLDTGPREEGAEPGVVRWPFPGQVGVPTSWNGLESPDPLRLYPGIEGPLGYTVSLTYSTRPARLELGSASLAGPDGVPVEVMVFSPHLDDHLEDTVAIIPVHPLAPNTTYSVRMTGVVDLGSGPRPFDEAWSFTTGSGQIEVGPRYVYSWRYSGDTVRFSFDDGLRLREGVRVFFGRLPVRDLVLSSPTEISFRLPAGFGTESPKELLLASAEGEEVLVRDLGGTFEVSRPGNAFTVVTARIAGGAVGEVPALRYSDGTVMVPTAALAGVGGVPFAVPEIDRTHWIMDGHTGCVTLGKTVAWVDGRMLALRLPAQVLGGAVHVPLEFARALVSAAHTFWDVAGHWAEEPVVRLAGQGIVSGCGEGAFQPEEKLTRAAFVKMLVVARGLDPEPGRDGGFADTAGHWVCTQGFIGPAVAAGIIRPEEYPRGLFEPDRNITREEIAVMVVRALGLENRAEGRTLGVLGGSATVGDKVFTDAGSWARPGYVAVAVEEGIVTGYPEAAGTYTFRPSSPATRAEAAVMVGRMLDRPGH